MPHDALAQGRAFCVATNAVLAASELALDVPQVCGDSNSLDLIKQTRPLVVVPFMNAETQVGCSQHVARHQLRRWLSHCAHAAAHATCPPSAVRASICAP